MKATFRISLLLRIQFIIQFIFLSLLIFPFFNSAFAYDTYPTPITVTTQASSLTESNQDYTFTLPASNPTTDCSQSADPNCQAQIGIEQPSAYAGLDPYAMAEMNNLLGPFAGPVSFGVKYSDLVSWTGNLGYTKMFNEWVGISSKFSGGPDEWRANITGGVALSPHQNLKVTYEYLNQNLPFDFESGEQDERIGQNAVGAAYQYVIPHSIFHAVQLSGSWAEADNKDIDSEVIYTDGQPYDDLMRVAGGEENTELASIQLLPFTRTLLTVGGGYSSVDYDTDYDTDDSDNSTVAYNVDLSVLPTITTKLSADLNNTASSQTVEGKISQLIPCNLELALWGQYSKGYNSLPDNSSVMLSLNYPAPPAYTFDNLNQIGQLYTWVNDPVVYYNQVLAIKDEAVQKIIISSNSLPNQTVSINESINSVSTDEAFDFDPTQFDQVTYTLSVTKAGSSSNKDYTKALNLQIQTVSNYEAEISSGSGGTPSGTEGKYVVTIAAKAQKSGLKNPLTAKSSFTLKVVSSAPEWQITTLPPATMGQPYPCVDLTAGGYVINPDDPNDSFIFKLVSSQSWLQISTQCVQTTGTFHASSNGTHYYLVASGAEQNTPVPANAAPSVILSATSQNNGLTTNQNFNLIINQIAPAWIVTPISLGSVVNTTLNQALPVSNPIPLDQFIQPSTKTGLSITIDPNAANGTNFVPSNWGIQQQNGHFYLIRTNNSGTDTGQVLIPIIAKNTTSTSQATNSVSIAVTAAPPAVKQVQQDNLNFSTL